ncbi:SET domain protein, partial [Ichthyophthirius multifiliis]
MDGHYLVFAQYLLQICLTIVVNQLHILLQIKDLRKNLKKNMNNTKQKRQIKSLNFLRRQINGKRKNIQKYYLQKQKNINQNIYIQQNKYIINIYFYLYVYIYIYLLFIQIYNYIYKNFNIFDNKMYSTTESEDNDTSEDDKKERKNQNNQLKFAEMKKFLNIVPKQIQQKKYSTNKNYFEDVLFQKEEDGCIIKLNQITIKQNKNQQIQNQNQEEDDQEQQWQSVSNSSSYISDISDESGFSWFDEDDEDNYFVVTTQKPEKKGQQIYNCYGQRTNKFLLMWYGFCFNKNRYDSYSLRLWINMRQEQLNNDLFEKIVFQEFLEKEDCKGGFVWKKQEKVNLDDITQNFRIKKNKINIDLIIYLRLYLMMHYKGPDLKRVMVSLPVSPVYECFVLSFAIRLLSYLLSRFTTTIKDDKELLQNQNLNYKYRFAIIYRLNQKEILQEQISLMNQALILLNQLKENYILDKDMLLKPMFNEKNLVESYLNRYKLKPYILQIYESYEYNLFQFPKKEVFECLK